MSSEIVPISTHLSCRQKYNTFNNVNNAFVSWPTFGDPDVGCSLAKDANPIGQHRGQVGAHAADLTFVQEPSSCRTTTVSQPRFRAASQVARPRAPAPPSPPWLARSRRRIGGRLKTRTCKRNRVINPDKDITRHKDLSHRKYLIATAVAHRRSSSHKRPWTATDVYLQYRFVPDLAMSTTH